MDARHRNHHAYSYGSAAFRVGSACATWVTDDGMFGAWPQFVLPCHVPFRELTSDSEEEEEEEERDDCERSVPETPFQNFFSERTEPNLIHATELSMPSEYSDGDGDGTVALPIDSYIDPEAVYGTLGEGQFVDIGSLAVSNSISGLQQTTKPRDPTSSTSAEPKDSMSLSSIGTRVPASLSSAETTVAASLSSVEPKDMDSTTALSSGEDLNDAMPKKRSPSTTPLSSVEEAYFHHQDTTLEDLLLTEPPSYDMGIQQHTEMRIQYAPDPFMGHRVMDGAAVLPYTFDPLYGNVYLLLGRRVFSQFKSLHGDMWTCFGGHIETRDVEALAQTGRVHTSSSSPCSSSMSTEETHGLQLKSNDAVIRAAAREFVEETLGQVRINEEQVLPVAECTALQDDLASEMYTCAIHVEYVRDGRHCAYTVFVKQIPWDAAIPTRFTSTRRSLQSRRGPEFHALQRSGHRAITADGRVRGAALEMSEVRWWSATALVTFLTDTGGTLSSPGGICSRLSPSFIPILITALLQIASPQDSQRLIQAARMEKHK